LPAQRILGNGIDCGVDFINDVARFAPAALVDLLKNLFEIGKRPAPIAHLHTTP
jgi:hypothetical protein